MFMITKFKIFENSDYFRDGDFILRVMDNTLYYVYDIKKRLYLKIGQYHYKEIKWGIGDLEKLKPISLRKLYEWEEDNELDRVLMTIPDNIIDKIDNITGGILKKQIEHYRLEKNMGKFDI